MCFQPSFSVLLVLPAVLIVSGSALLPRSDLGLIFLVFVIINKQPPKAYHLQELVLLLFYWLSVCGHVCPDQINDQLV